MTVRITAGLFLVRVCGNTLAQSCENGEVPRSLDHDARETAVGEAAWRVLVRDGITALSVRNVAAEAGLAASSLRYTFPTQASLRVFALELVARRAEARIRALPPGATVRASVEERLRHLLPLDAERRLEMEVFLVIGTVALTDPALRPVYDRASEDLRAGCADLLTALATDPAYAGLDVAAETPRLHALVDGLALHLVYQGPRDPTGWATDALARHLDSLAAV
ncbi:TetR family transcriptional regulator [Clavibacter capsici]|uniref:TetR family transcriptional regulator n=1 Tax=Clavibacter capsici TaxID=1874630 RepID=A0AAE6XTE6_9MICO|nr:TetR family transcriptional regulator [Clavibacter capsici]